MKLLRLGLVLAWFSVAAGAAAQTLPSEPMTFGDGHVVLGGDVSAAFGPDDPGYFNYSDYEHSTLRQFRVGVRALVRASQRLSFLAEFRSDNLHAVQPFALYARVRPFPGRRLDVQVGRIPPTFGRFARQSYGRDNPLIGYPLAYQYLTSLRPDALPADPDELFRMRSRGWLSNYVVGDLAPARGVPLTSAANWDTGVQVTTGWKAVEVTGAVTSGTLSNPRVSDDNAGKQIAARVTVAATPGLSIGSSFARGQFVSSNAVLASGGDDDDAYQQAIGLDLEYARGHLLARAEGIVSEWRIPFAGIGRTDTLRAMAVSTEGRYMLLPGAYGAIRVEHLGFSRLSGSTQRLGWEAPVNRIEVGGGYYLQRNLVARLSFQVNDRETGRVTHAKFVAAQLLYWF